jgi:hypothetical protein
LADGQRDIIQGQKKVSSGLPVKFSLQLVPEKLKALSVVHG